MKHPFQQKKVNGKLIREFSDKVSSDELVWHRDRADRNVYVKKCEGWKLQLENKLPVTLKQGSVYYIPKNTYHRIIKGRNSLIVEIQESSEMKITKRQLRRIIREAITSDSDFILGAITEMGYDLSQPPTLDSNNIAIDDALAGYPGEFTYEDIITALEDQKAASEIMGTRAGSYKGTTLPGGKKI